ncbi:MAG: hypothetical protein U5N58_08105 [Actinomycetota bacterium]|nr:hypothetical protein [Actinomycetota bacterium]
MPENYLETIRKHVKEAPAGSYLSLKLLESRTSTEAAPEKVKTTISK